jgi:tetratricopeptide (TPR) repeat protein
MSASREEGPGPERGAGEGDGRESPEERGERVYDLFRRGSQLLDAGDFAAAAIPLERARALEPDKTSIREALGRAYFRLGRYEAARGEFAAVVERSPVNDFAHFCLGRSLQKTGRRKEARRHLALAACMRPDRADYRVYRDRAASA